MGCNSSSVVPVAENDTMGKTGIKVRVNPSTPDDKMSKKGESNGAFKRKLKPLKNGESQNETVSKNSNKQETNAVNVMNSGPPVPPPLPPLSFDVPIFEESIIKKHPPKKLKRLELAKIGKSKSLTHEIINTKQQEAEMRRKEILNQRILSAQQKNNQVKRLLHVDTLSQKAGVRTLRSEDEAMKVLLEDTN